MRSSLFLALVLASCAPPFEPQLPLIEPAELQITTLTLTDHHGLAGLRIEVHGMLDRGRLANGARPALANDSLYVLGSAFPPSLQDEYTFVGFVPKESVGGHPVLRAPAIRGLGPAPEVDLALPHRIGPDTVFVRSGERPVLRLETPAGDEPEFLRWQFFVPKRDPHWRGPSDRIVLQGHGAPPDAIPVPEDVLPITGPAEVTLSYSTETVTIGNPDYRITVQFVVHQVWLLTPGLGS
jgi:hypothetical protein